MVPFLLQNFRKFLNWYLFCFKIFALFSNGTIFFQIFCTLLKWYHILVSKIFLLYSNGTFFVAELFLNGTICVCDFCCRIFAHSSIDILFVTKFLHFSRMVPFLFYFLSHFAQIGNTVFKAIFCIGTFWRQKVKRGLNFWGFNRLKNPLFYLFIPSSCCTRPYFLHKCANRFVIYLFLA